MSRPPTALEISMALRANNVPAITSYRDGFKIGWLVARQESVEILKQIHGISSGDPDIVADLIEQTLKKWGEKI